MGNLTHFFIILVSLLLSKTESRSLSEYLTNTLLTEQQISREHQVSKDQTPNTSNPKPPAKYYADIKNLDGLKRAVRNQHTNGRGAYGCVFKVKGVDYESPDEEKTFGVKVIKFDNRGDTPQGAHEQNALQQELEVALDLDRLDEGHLFFPKYYGFYEVSSMLKSNYSLHESEDLNLDRHQDAAALFMDFLDSSLAKYVDTVLSEKTQSLFITRLRIFLNLGQALVLFEPLYSHCDLKFENVMLKGVSESEALRLQGQGVEPLELYPGRFYQAQIIDFGLAAKGQPARRRCHGGTPVTLAPEFFDKGASHGTFDLYSSAVMAISLELASVQYFGFETLLATANRVRKNHSEGKAKDLSVPAGFKDDVTRLNFYKVGEWFWKTSSGLKGPFARALAKYIPAGVLTKVKKRFGLTDIKSTMLLNIWRFQAEALYGLAFAILDVFYNHHFKDAVVQKNVQRLAEIKAQYDQSKAEAQANSEDYKKAHELGRYYQALITLEEAQCDAKIGYVNFMLTVVSSKPKSRPGLAQMFSFVEETLTEVSQTYWAQYSYIGMVARVYAIENLKPTADPEFPLETQMEMQEINRVTQKRVSPDFRRRLV